MISAADNPGESLLDLARRLEAVVERLENRFPADPILRAPFNEAEAVIQRVREACDHERCYGEYGRDAEVVAAVPVHVVLRALDGDGDD